MKTSRTLKNPTNNVNSLNKKQKPSESAFKLEVIHE